MEQLRKEKEIDQARKDYVKALSTLRITEEEILASNIDTEKYIDKYYENCDKYNDYILLSNNRTFLNVHYDLINFLLNQDKEFRRKYEYKLEILLSIDYTDEDYRKLIDDESESEKNYDSEAIRVQFTRYLESKLLNAQSYDDEVVYRYYYKDMGIYEENPDWIIQLLMDGMETINYLKENKWAMKLSEIEANKEKLINEEFESISEKEKIEEDLALDCIEILDAFYKGEKISHDNFIRRFLISTMVNYCGTIGTKIVEQWDDVAFEQFITTRPERKTIESILTEEDSKRFRTDAKKEMWASIIEEDKANIVPVNKSYIKIRENRYHDLELIEII